MPMGTDGTRRTALVAGGTGFLGAAFVRLLHDRGHPTVVLSRDATKVPRRFPDRDVEGRSGDVTRPETLPAALAGADVVIQAVQFPGFPVEDPARGHTFREVDARGTANLARAAAAAGVDRLVYLSGVGADASSDRPWYRAKGMAERAVREAGLGGTIVRPSWVYGPEDRSLNLFATIIRRLPGVFPQLGSGLQRLNPLFVEDLARAVVAAVESPSFRGRTVEIGGPDTRTMDGVVRVLMDALGRRKPILHVPLRPVRALAAAAELLPGRPLSRDAVEFVTQGAVADLSSLRELLPDLELTPLPAALSTYEPGSGRPAGS